MQLLPTGVRLDVVQDQSRYIEAALHEIQLHLVLGSILASLGRAALYALLARDPHRRGRHPGFGHLDFRHDAALNFTLNSVTMLALVLMVGVVIDDAIVVLENIFRFIEEKKMPPMQAAVKRRATLDSPFWRPRLSLVVIFLPVSFMSSSPDAFFTHLVSLRR